MDNSQLVDQLQQADPTRRLQALQALLGLDLASVDARVFDAIVDSLSDQNAKVKAVALSLLCNTRYSKAKIVLKKHILIEDDPRVLTRISMVMGQFNDSDTVVESKASAEEPPHVLLNTFIDFFEALVPFYHFSPDGIPPIKDDDVLLYYLQNHVLTDTLCVYVEHYQYEASAFNALLPLAKQGITLYDDKDELIEQEAEPYELFIEHFNTQLAPHKLMLVDLFGHENPSLVCVSTEDQLKLDAFFTFLNQIDMS